MVSLCLLYFLYLKKSEFSLVLRTRENSDVSTHSMKYIWYLPQKRKHPLFTYREDCALKGGQLVQINDMVEEDFLMSILHSKMFTGDGLWIGLSDQDTEGQFVWTNGRS